MEIVLITAAVASAGAAVHQGQVARAQGKAEQKMAEFNARQKEMEAKAHMESARMEEQRLARQRRAALGQAKAAYGKSGIAIEEGSPIDVLADMAYQFDIDRNLTLRAGMQNKEFMKSHAAMDRWHGKFANRAGKQARTASFIQAGGSLLGAGAELSQPSTHQFTSSQKAVLAKY